MRLAVRAGAHGGAVAGLRSDDENLARADLSPAQEASHIARRKKIWEEMREKPETIGGRNSPTNDTRKDGRKKGPQHDKQFAAEVAAVVGDGRNPESVKRDVNLKIRRAEALGPDIDRIAGTSLDYGVEMDALIKMPEPERREIIDRADIALRTLSTMNHQIFAPLMGQPVTIENDIVDAGVTARGFRRIDCGTHRHIVLRDGRRFSWKRDDEAGARRAVADALAALSKKSRKVAG